MSLEVLLKDKVTIAELREKLPECWFEFSKHGWILCYGEIDGLLCKIKDATGDITQDETKQFYLLEGNWGKCGNILNYLEEQGVVFEVL